MKRLTCLAVSILMFAGLPLWAQESAQTADRAVANGSNPVLNERLPNTSGFAVLSKSTPQELKNYPFRVLAGVRNKWYPQIAELRKSAAWKRGMTVVEFEINRDGSVVNQRTVESASDAALDAAAIQAISSAAPFPMLPDSYGGQTLQLRYHFGYDQPASASAPMCNGPIMGAHPSEYVVHKLQEVATPPRATSSPDPEYSDPARKAKYQSRVRIAGTVDPQGAFTDLCVLIGAGYGLDENAIAATKVWRFEPATLEGKPAAVRINVEVDFRLY